MISKFSKFLTFWSPKKNAFSQIQVYDHPLLYAKLRALDVLLAVRGLLRGTEQENTTTKELSGDKSSLVVHFVKYEHAIHE